MATRLLLDTHIFLWVAYEPERISARVRSLSGDPAIERLFSVASAWEITIKYSNGKLWLADPPSAFFAEQVRDQSLVVLPIGFNHLGVMATLPHHHRDPFDRLLIAQAIAENVPFVSADATLDSYAGLTRLW